MKEAKTPQSKSITIRVTSVTVKDSNYGIFNFKSPKYARVHHTKIGQCLFVEGYNEANERVYFYTPQATIIKCDGMLYYKKLKKNTGNFFKEVAGTMTGHKSCFDGDEVMPVAISDSTEIVPAISVNDTITVQYGEIESKYGALKLKRVRLIK